MLPDFSVTRVNSVSPDVKIAGRRVVAGKLMCWVVMAELDEANKGVRAVFVAESVVLMENPSNEKRSATVLETDLNVYHLIPRKSHPTLVSSIPIP